MDWDLVVPIPASKQLFKRRLFYPCNELALKIARDHKIDTVCALTQNTQRAPQATLGHDDRIKRLRTLFKLEHGVEVSARRILLIEDVITTGATIAAATYTLKRHGAARVDVLSLARTSVWGRFRGTIHKLLP
jgi:predicted amidophosphoribosyltransferase